MQDPPRLCTDPHQVMQCIADWISTAGFGMENAERSRDWLRYGLLAPKTVIINLNDAEEVPAQCDVVIDFTCYVDDKAVDGTQIDVAGGNGSETRVEGAAYPREAFVAKQAKKAAAAKLARSG